jgi:hypothetical protein
VVLNDETIQDLNLEEQDRRGEVPNLRYRAGMRKRLRAVDVTRPPTMTTAIGCSIS